MELHAAPDTPTEPSYLTTPPEGHGLARDAAAKFAESLRISGPPEWAVSLLVDEGEGNGDEWLISVGPTEIVNTDGYTGDFEYRLTPATYVTDVTHAKPGFADLIRVPGTLEATFTNTTNGRESPAPNAVRAFAYYPADSFACGDVLLHEQPARLKGEVIPGTETAIPAWAANNQYCFIETENTGSIHGLGGVPSGAAEALDGKVAIVRFMNNIEGVEEATAEDIAEALSQPLGVVVTVGGWSTSATSDCAGVQARVTEMRGLSEDSLLSDDKTTFASGPLCEG